MSGFRPNFFAIFIILIIAGISIALPIIFLSEVNKEANAGEGWVPDPTDTPTFTFTPVLPPTLTNTPEIVSSLLNSSASEGNTNCVYPFVYWEQHPEFWLDLVIGGTVYSVDDIQRVFDEPFTDIYTELFRQVYLVNLNIISGADPAPIRSTLDEANIWFQNYSLDSTLSFDAKQIILQLAQRLSDFNTGLIGPGLCSGYESFSEARIVLTLPPTLTPTSTNTPTFTATSIPTFTPSKTPTATKKPTKEPEKPEPPKPTKEPPTEAPPPPTDPPPPPKPTVAPPKPTDPPKKPTPTPAS